MIRKFPLSIGLAIGIALLAASEAPLAAQALEPGQPAATHVAPVVAPARSGVAEADGVRIHYYVHGDLEADQTPLLVLHGAYMSAESMAPFVERFARTRPVIVIDQRGHGRTGDAAGRITYEAMADDAAAVLDAVGVRQADVFGYSMGGGAALQLAIRHPDRVLHLVPVSAGTRFSSMYPEVIAGIAQITPSVFDNTPIRHEYDRLAPRPQDFPLLVEKLKVLDATAFDWSAAVQELRQPTMIVMGDYDIVTPEHAVEMFRLRGGGDAATAAQGFLTDAPPARLLILPAVSHIGVMNAADMIVGQVTPFLDDAAPPVPAGFF